MIKRFMRRGEGILFEGLAKFEAEKIDGRRLFAVFKITAKPEVISLINVRQSGYENDLVQLQTDENDPKVVWAQVRGAGEINITGAATVIVCNIHFRKAILGIPAKKEIRVTGFDRVTPELMAQQPWENTAS